MLQLTSKIARNNTHYHLYNIIRISRKIYSLILHLWSAHRKS